MREWKPGDVLPNGATIHVRSGTAVACRLPDNPVTPWVVWRLDLATGATYAGRYCESAMEMTLVLIERAFGPEAKLPVVEMQHA